MNFLSTYLDICTMKYIFIAGVAAVTGQGEMHCGSTLLSKYKPGALGESLAVLELEQNLCASYMTVLLSAVHKNKMTELKKWFWFAGDERKVTLKSRIRHLTLVVVESAHL